MDADEKRRRAITDIYRRLSDRTIINSIRARCMREDQIVEITAKALAGENAVDSTGIVRDIIQKGPFTVTTFHSSDRPRIGSMPAWADRHAVLPSIELSPHDSDEVGLWTLTIMFRGSWKSILIRESDIIPLLREWQTSPEQFLQTVFNIVPPRAGNPAPVPIDHLDDLDDLDF